MSRIMVVYLRDKQRFQAGTVPSNQATVVCYKRAILQEAVHKQGRSFQTRETSFPWRGGPAPKGISKGEYTWYIHLIL